MLPAALPSIPMPDWQQALHKLGYDDFRPGQQEAVECLLQERQLLLVAPTGGGKSLCYQLPACVLPGTTVVISPLIALMHDQVAHLTQRGVAATFLASTLTAQEQRHRFRQLRLGAYKLVYVSPERLLLDGFLDLCQQMEIPFVAVDEAHCISEWGHDFRPEYARIGEFLAQFPHTLKLACTATATPFVRDEILAKLGLPSNTRQMVRGFARPNLALHVQEVQSNQQRRQVVCQTLQEVLGPSKGSCKGSAIVYASTRKQTEEEAVYLQRLGYKVAPYHAGMSGKRREEVLQQFRQGQLTIAVATCAFGMGIDRSDVRLVIHLSPPGSIEAYYQEVGRAGRDGASAHGLLLHSPSDLPLRRALLERAVMETGAHQVAVLEHKWHLFLELMRWAEGGSCRHDGILRYFGDTEHSLTGCGHCDVCLRLAVEEHHTPEQVQEIVRKALSGVARLHGRFGLRLVLQLLRGVSEPKLTAAKLDQTSTFGLFSHYPEAWIRALLRRCITAGWIDFRGSPWPVVVLTPTGRAVMKAEQPARLLLPPSLPGAPLVQGISPEKSTPSGRQPMAAENFSGTALLLFEQLRRIRLVLAKQEGLPPYVIASDRTLRELVMFMPRNLHQLQQIHGIGATKAEKFGRHWLQAIDEHVRNQGEQLQERFSAS